MMTIISDTTAYALWHPVRGLVPPKGQFFATKEEASAEGHGECFVVAVHREVYSCDHETQMAYTVGHGKNAGKWVAVCAHCGAKSRGRPKSTEAIAHASLSKHPCVRATKTFELRNV